MVDQRRRQQWRRTATLCAALANGPLKPKPGKRPWTADDFDPYVERPSRGQGTGIPLDKAGLRAFGRLLFGFR